MYVTKVMVGDGNFTPRREKIMLSKTPPAPITAWSYQRGVITTMSIEEGMALSRELLKFFAREEMKK